MNETFSPIRMETPKTRAWRVVAWLIGGFLIAYAYAFILATTTDSEDVAECKNIVSAVTPQYAIPLSTSAPGRAGIFCDLGVHFPVLTSYDTVFIYGVVGQNEQDEIAGTLKDFRRTSHTRKILLQFFEKENWKTWSDPTTGRSGGSRGPETPIREVWIK